MKVRITFDIKCPNCSNGNLHIYPPNEPPRSIFPQVVVKCLKCQGIWDIGKTSGKYKISKIVLDKK